MNLREIPKYTTGRFHGDYSYSQGERQALIDDRKAIAQLLYNLCTRLEYESQMSSLALTNPGLNEWWEARKFEDRQEAARQAALGKLTPAERELLGIRE